MEGRTPCRSTLQHLFCKLDGQALAAALSAHFAPVAVPLPGVAGSQGVAIDGKAQRGRLPFRVGGSPLHALTAFCHWAMENRLHRVKDVTLGEDQSTIHLGQGPTVMAFLRDAAVSLLRRAGIHQISARLRDHAQDPTAAVALVLTPPPALTHA